MRKSLFVLLAATALPLMMSADRPLERSRRASSGLSELTPGKMARIQRADASPRELPAEFPLSTKADIEACTTIDANGDGKTWIFDSGAACYEGIGTTAAPDDYLVVGAVNFNTPSGEYSLSLQAKKLYIAESFEICLSATGTATDAVSVFSCTDVANDWAQLDGDFSIAPGVYYVMIHCNSASPGLSLYVRNLVISAVEGEVNFTVPFEMVPEATEAKYFTFIDANEDGKSWKFDTSNIGLTYEYSPTNVADDYALFPEIEITEPGNYKFAFDARGWGSSLESMEVLFGQGDDPARLQQVFADRAIGADIYRRQVVVSVAQPGKYRLALHCSSPANRYKLLVKNFSLTATDEQPARHLPVDFDDNLTLQPAVAAYTPAFIVPDNARVKITLTTSGDAITLSAGNAPEALAQKEVATVEASAEATTVSRLVNFGQGGIFYLGLTSEGAATVSDISLQLVSEGDIYALPFTMQPTADEFGEFMTINSNNDDGVWSYYEQFGAARYNFSIHNDADDWLILPAINIPSTDGMIRFAVNVRGMGESPKFTETFEVWEGETTDISSMRKIYSSPEIRNEAFTPMEFAFAPTHAGKTYLAVRATSKKNAFHLFLRDFKVEADGRQTTVPAPVLSLTATPQPMGSEEADVAFTMPSLDEGGNPLGADETLTATVATAAATVTLQGVPGQEMATAILNGQGNGTVTVTVANASGTSNPAQVSVYTGQDIPSPVTDLTATCSEDNRTMTITWTQPSEGANGGYADPAQMTFVIRHSEGGGSYTRVGSTEGVCEFTYKIPDSYPLAMHYLAVLPTNVAGECPTQVGKGLMLGKPHTIPANEDFAGGQMSLQPIAMEKPADNYTLDWYFDNPADAFPEAANESGFALIAFTQEEGAARGCLHLPKFSTITDNGARLTLRLYNFPHFAPTHVSALTYDGAIDIATIQPSEEAGWVTYSLPLPAELNGLQWIEPVIDFGFDGSNDDEIWMLDAYGMENYFDRELTLTPVSTHSSMTAQKEYLWSFTVANYGRETLTFTVPELNFTTLDGDVFPVAEATRPGAEVTLKTTETTLLTYKVKLDASMEGDLVYDITTLVDGDGDMDNNFIFGETSLKVQDEYVVRDLEASRTDGTNEVNLTWSDPRVDNGTFDCERLDSWDYGSTLGLFTNIDRDQERTIGFNIATFPGMNAAKAWQVWDYQQAGLGEIYMGHNLTTRSLIAFSPFDYTKQADDWLISPEVEGGTQLEFFVRPLSYQYGREVIEIYLSSTGDAIEDFTLAKTFQTAEMDGNLTPYWETVRLDLPADTRHFAIRYASKDIFGLQLDDITYTPAQADAADLAYTIFRNGEAIAEGISGNGYTDSYDGPATYYVAAEKKHAGLHPLSNRAEVIPASGVTGVTASDVTVTTLPGRIIITTPAPITATVTNVDGRTWHNALLPAGETTIPLPSGIYLLDLDGQPARKLIVN